MRSKTIELFLINGDFSGPVTAELANWNGKAIKISREDININREELTGVGVYFLFCADEYEGVYIGESENVQQRLKQHIQDYKSKKENYFWTQAVVFTSNNLDKAKIRYLENKFVVDANNANRYTILTKASSKNVPLKESAIAEMEEFAEKVKLIIYTLGFKLFKENKINTNKKDLYYISTKDAEASMIITNEGFVVLSGSSLATSIAKSCPKNAIIKREELLDKAIISKDNKLIKDVVFGSSSSAAAFILGYSVSGNVIWKDKNGNELGSKNV